MSANYLQYPAVKQVPLAAHVTLPPPKVGVRMYVSPLSPPVDTAVAVIRPLAVVTEATLPLAVEIFAGIPAVPPSQPVTEFKSLAQSSTAALAADVAKITSENLALLVYV